MKNSYLRYMKNISLSIIAALALSSCGTYVYQSTTTKPNFFEEKGDWEVGVNTGVGNTGEVYAAYAFANNWAIGGAFAGSIINRDSIFIPAKNSNDFNEYKERQAHNEFQLYGTYFAKVNNGKTVECQFGFGIFEQSLKYKPVNTPFEGNPPSNFYEQSYNRYFVQPAYGLTSENFDWGILARIEYIDYQNYKNDLLISPQLFLRYGFKNVKFMAQGGFTTCPIYESNTLYSLINMGFGVHFTFNKYGRKNSEYNRAKNGELKKTGTPEF
jgi:hypothetical protein